MSAPSIHDSHLSSLSSPTQGSGHDTRLPFSLALPTIRCAHPDDDDSCNNCAAPYFYPHSHLVNNPYKALPEQSEPSVLCPKPLSSSLSSRIIEPSTPAAAARSPLIRRDWRNSWQSNTSMASSTSEAVSDTTPDLSSAASSIKSSCRSSCSSSLRSVSFPDDELRDTVDFEDISLADDTKCMTTTPAKRPSLRLSKTTGALSPRSSLTTNDALRATATRNHHARSLRQPPSPRQQWARSPPSTSLSPPSAFSGRPFPSQRTHSSPNQLTLSPRSPQTPRFHSDVSPMLSPQRTSWQTNGKRKTTKELEAEYDELDDDLPEDAIFWNVPCLRPVESRAASLSPTTSRTQRTSSSGPDSNSISPRRSSPERGDLKVRGAPTPRVKSWDEVMRELSDDARKLTAALEYRHDTAPVTPLQRSGSKLSRSSRPTFHKSNSSIGSISPPSTASSSASSIDPSEPATPSPSPNVKRPALTTTSGRSHTVAVPTLQSLSLDPLPPSKEKERFLTRTRPSWLPPKCPKEERKHMKEWEKIVRRTGGIEIPLS